MKKLFMALSLTFILMFAMSTAAFAADTTATKPQATTSLQSEPIVQNVTVDLYENRTENITEYDARPTEGLISSRYEYWYEPVYGYQYDPYSHQYYYTYMYSRTHCNLIQVYQHVTGSYLKTTAPMGTSQETYYTYESSYDPGSNTTTNITYVHHVTVTIMRSLYGWDTTTQTTVTPQY